MKRKQIIFIIIALLIVGVVGLLSYLNQSSNQGKELIYDSKNSFLNEFYFDKDNVVFECSIKVKNVTDKDLHFNMYANVKNEIGLVNEEFATAYKKDSLEKEDFFIKANSEEMFKAYFKAKRGEKTTKSDRNPPKEIKFEILK
ncbi:hypothetical protein [Petroclostridium xylanilyticum]|jgi:hypothetical protein|uniref:hypothetical protein n=1 Tax=Petroclostridium xylanilyticum TaxID=1792311 RepID=UPI000B990923|nr:hypothetical protein [Petroclostridium xylanilyticum]